MQQKLNRSICKIWKKKCYEATEPNALTHFATIYIKIAIISNVGWSKSHEKNFFIFKSKRIRVLVPWRIDQLAEDPQPFCHQVVEDAESDGDTLTANQNL